MLGFSTSFLNGLEFPEKKSSADHIFAELHELFKNASGFVRKCQEHLRIRTKGALTIRFFDFKISYTSL